MRRKVRVKKRKKCVQNCVDIIAFCVCVENSVKDAWKYRKIAVGKTVKLCSKLRGYCVEKSVEMCV